MSSPQQPHHVRVGVGVLVKDAQGKIYAGLRKGSHGAGSLALPGGHLELMEEWGECAVREVKEEMNVDLDNIEFVHVTNDRMPDEEKHYVTIFMAGESGCQEPENMEPEKCEGWQSYTWDELKEIRIRGSPVLFGPLGRLIDDEPQQVMVFLGSTWA